MEMVRIHLLVVNTLNLNGRGEEPILATAQVGHGSQSL